MNKILLMSGLVFVIIGIVLLGTFPWAFYKNAKDVKLDDYKEGDKVTVYGKITDVEYSDLINKTVIELEHNLTVYLDGKLKGYDVGDFVFMTIEKKDLVQFGNFKISGWHTVAKDIHRVSDILLYFYALIFLGVVIAVIAIFIR